MILIRLTVPAEIGRVRLRAAVRAGRDQPDRLVVLPERRRVHWIGGGLDDGGGLDGGGGLDDGGGLDGGEEDGGGDELGGGDEVGGDDFFGGGDLGGAEVG